MEHLRKLFNKNNLKVSSKIGPGLGQILAANNARVIRDTRGGQRQQEKPCNCKKRECPLPGRCREKEVIYRATVEVEYVGRQPEKAKYYIGQPIREIKEMIGKAESDMNNQKLKHTTALTTYIWKLKDLGKVS